MKNKSMKIIALFISFLLVLSLSACYSKQTVVELSQERTEIRLIEIYCLERAYYEGDVHELREENTPEAILTEDVHATFLDVFCTLEYEKEMSFFPIPMDGGYDYAGYVIAVVYADGGYDLFADGGRFYYAADEGYQYDYADYCGEVAWEEFVLSYVQK